MRLIVALLLALHGIAHFVGFRSAFWPGPIRPRRLVHLPLRLEGAGWLILGIAFIAVAAAALMQQPSWTLLLLAASAASLLLCVVAWPEAKIGVAIDVGLVVLALLLTPPKANPHLVSAFSRELSQSGVRLGAGTTEVVEERSIADLPTPVQRYLRFMGVLGKPRDVSLRASFTARFRRDQGEWDHCEALQYDTRSPVSRVFIAFNVAPL